MAKALTEKIKLNKKATRTIIYSVQKYSRISTRPSWKSKVLSFDSSALAIKRNDTSDIQHHILAMTPAKRKRLAINKSTLWYQNKKLAEGNTLKV